MGRYLKDIEASSEAYKKIWSYDSCEYIELPVRKACIDLNNKGIDTIMSSANKRDCKNGNVPENQNQYLSIGNGYAWIMIDYDQLNEQNRDLIDKLNNGEEKVYLSDKAKNILIHNCSINGIQSSQSELFKFYRVKESSPDTAKYYRRPNKIPTPIQNDKFEEQARTLFHSNSSFSNYSFNFRGVALRYPIEETTEVEEVIKYFEEVIQLMINQKVKVGFKALIKSDGSR